MTAKLAERSPNNAALFGVSLGQSLKKLREDRGLTVREIARRAGVSASLVSQIERGRVTPSVATLYQLATEFGLPIDALFSGTVEPATEREVSAPLSRGPILRLNDRKRISLAGGVTWERLTPSEDETVEFMHVTYQVGGASCPDDSLVRHGGREYACVLSGKLGLQIGFEEYELNPGDSFAFDPQQPHRLWAIGNAPATAIWFIVGRTNDPRNQTRS